MYGTIGLLLFANIINIGADIAAMGAAANLLVGGPMLLYCVFFACISVLLQIFVPYKAYSGLPKWLTLSLFAYVGTAFVVQIHWPEVLRGSLIPDLSFKREYMAALIAVLGTTTDRTGTDFYPDRSHSGTRLVRDDQWNNSGARHVHYDAAGQQSEGDGKANPSGLSESVRMVGSCGHGTCCDRDVCDGREIGFEFAPSIGGTANKRWPAELLITPRSSFFIRSDLKPEIMLSTVFIWLRLLAQLFAVPSGRMQNGVSLPASHGASRLMVPSPPAITMRSNGSVNAFAQSFSLIDA
ncbi:MAG: divalent metal cation transporter [Chthoniobacterales bacterium]